MKIAIISDIHGNTHTFIKALELMKKERVDKIICCGDICGYYYSQNDIINYCRATDNLICVRGNHDQAFLDIYEGKKGITDYTNVYGRSMELLLDTISKKDVVYLQQLPTEYISIIDGLYVAVFHGSPWNKLDGYFYPDSDYGRYGELPFDYIFQGHTHYRSINTVGDKCILNPGSIGQPRDGALPAYALLDTRTKEIVFVDVDFDEDLLIAETERNEEKNAYLAKVLKRFRV